MPLRIADGYTISGKTTGKGFSESDSLPVVRFEYRPPTALEMSTLRRDLRDAKSGPEEHRVRVAFVVARLVKWDVENERRPGEVLSIDASSVALLPDEVFIDLFSETQKWKPKPGPIDPDAEEKARKESAGNS